MDVKVAVLALAAVAVVATTASVPPHQDSDDSTCVVCKARNQPILQLSGPFEPSRPAPTASASLLASTGFESLSEPSLSPPRAPPA